MTTITQILRDVHDDLKLGFRSDFISGTIEENNLDERLIEMIVMLIKPITARPTFENAGRKWTYPSIKMIFAKLDSLENSDEEHEKIIAVCMSVYDQFINRLRKVEFIQVTEGDVVQIYNDKDANLTGISVSFQVVQTSTDSLCTL